MRNNKLSFNQARPRAEAERFGFLSLVLRLFVTSVGFGCEQPVVSYATYERISEYSGFIRISWAAPLVCSNWYVQVSSDLKTWNAYEDWLNAPRPGGRFISCAGTNCIWYVLDQTTETQKFYRLIDGRP